jgi:SRSO17 transposase
MLPETRQDDSYSVPKFEIDPKDIEGFEQDLLGFHENFADCFQRSESRNHFLSYMVGQFSEIKRKSIEPIAHSVEKTKLRALQRFVSDAYWDEEKMLYKYHNLVNEDLGHPNGAIIFDECGFPKKGDDSIGVAKQYCGTLGKVENCQVGVFAAYTSPYGYSLIDKRLFIPEKWFTKEYKERRDNCNLPKDYVFKSKPQLAAEMLSNTSKEDILPFRYVLADSIYGNSPDFINAVEVIPNAQYFVQVSSSTTCWLKQPSTIEKEYKYRGKKQSRKVLTDESQKPITVDKFAKNLNNFFWYRRKISEGTKGAIEYEFTKRRIILAHDNLPQKEVWLVVRRTLEEEPTYSFYISNALTSTRLKTFVWLSGLRWSIEQCFKETKSELGMDQYEVRKFTGWQHHILTCMLAHYFLWHLMIKMGKKSTSYYTSSTDSIIEDNLAPATA